MKIVIVDTETGGTNSNIHALLQLSAIVCSRNEDGTFSEICDFNNFIRPTEHFPLTLTEEALAINRIAISKLEEEGRDEEDVIKEFTSFCHPHRNNGNFPIFTGWNVNFDLDFVRAAYKRHSIPFPFYHIVMDVAERWRWEKIVVYGEPQFGGINQAAKQLTGKDNVTHDALDDVRVTLDILNWFARFSK
jgi:DNA polymerase III alpha subunit (gram-positive type)